MSSEQSTITTPTNQATGGADLLTAALDLNAGGLRVIPFWNKEGGKKTFLTGYRKYREREQTRADVQSDFQTKQGGRLADGIALLCTDGIEAIDIDLKHDPKGTIIGEYLEQVKQFEGGPGLVEKCIVQSTKSGGLHIIYRAENTQGSQKLAQRAGFDDDEAMLETRGAGGLLFIAPTPGYKVERGALNGLADIPTITPDERNILIMAAHELNEVFDSQQGEQTPDSEPGRAMSTGGDGLKPGEDFDQKHSVLDMLLDFGWRQVGKRGDFIYLNRPGAKHGRGVDGEVMQSKNRFKAFSTSTKYDTAKGKTYGPFAVYTMERHSGNFSEAAKFLRAKGYGSPLVNQLPTQKSKQGSAANPGRNAGQTTPAETTPPPANLATFAAITADRVTIVQDDTAARAALNAGLQNVVDAGPDGLQPDHIRAALDAGAKVFTVCFGDPAATFATVETLLKYHETEQETFFVMAAELPDGFNSLGDFAKENGSEAAAELLTHADGAAAYLAKWFANVRAAEIVRNQAGGRFDAAILRPYFKAEISRLFRLLPVSESAYFQHVLNDVAENYFLTWDEIKHDAETLREREAARRYEERAAKLAAQAGQAFADGDAEKGEAILAKVKEERGKVGAAKLAQMMEGQDRAAYVGRLSKKGSKLETGYYFRRKGMEPEQLEIPAAGITVVGGSTGHGKTTFLINLLLEICSRYPEKEFHFFSLEESAEAQAAKALNCFCDIDLSARNGASIEAYLTRGTEEFIKAAARLDFEEKEAQFWALIGKQIFFHYPEDSTAENLTAAIRYLHKRRNVGGIFIDYFQLLTLENAAKIRERTEQLKAICLMVKDTAIETGLPLIFAAQFNRQVNREEDLDFRKIGEAGDIERIAALVVGLWDRHQTPEIWGTDAAGKPENISKPAPEMYAKILKQRGGAVSGEGVFLFDANRAKIRTNTPANQGQGAANKAQPGQKFNPNQNPFQNI